MKKNNEIRESIVSSANNILGDDILDHKLRREKLVALRDAYHRASNEAAKAKVRKAMKIAEDTLKDTVASLLTDEFQTAEAIVDAIGDEEVSKAKVVNRLSKLIADGIAVKEQTKVGDRKVVCYKLV